MPTRHMNQEELSRRWGNSPRTLERWRWLGIGPQYLKIGGHVVYRLQDVEAYEAARSHSTAPTSTAVARAHVGAAAQTTESDR